MLTLFSPLISVRKSATLTPVIRSRTLTSPSTALESALAEAKSSFPSQNRAPLPLEKISVLVYATPRVLVSPGHVLVYIPVDDRRFDSRFQELCSTEVASGRCRSKPEIAVVGGKACVKTDGLTFFDPPPALGEQVGYYLGRCRRIGSTRLSLQ